MSHLGKRTDSVKKVPLQPAFIVLTWNISQQSSHHMHLNNRSLGGVITDSKSTDFSRAEMQVLHAGHNLISSQITNQRGINANYDRESQCLHCICSVTHLQPPTAHILILRLASGTTPWCEMCPFALRFAPTAIKQPVTGRGETSHNPQAQLEQRKSQIHEYSASFHTPMHDRCILVLKGCQSHSLQFPCEIRVAPFLGAVGFVALSSIFLQIGLGLELLLTGTFSGTKMASIQTFLFSIFISITFIFGLWGCLQLKYICQEFKYFLVIAHISSLQGLSRQKESHTTKSVTWAGCVSSRLGQRRSPAGIPSSLAAGGWHKALPWLQPETRAGDMWAWCAQLPLPPPRWAEQPQPPPCGFAHPLGIQGWSGQKSCTRGRGVHKMLYQWI